MTPATASERRVETTTEKTVIRPFQIEVPEADLTGQINRFGRPTGTELQSSNDMFLSTLALPDAQARRAKVRGIGYGLPSDFELNFGRYLPAFGRADNEDTKAQRE